MAPDALPVVPFERDRHEAALFRFVEKVIGAQKFASRRKALEWLHAGMPLRDRHPTRFVIMDGERVAASIGHMPADFLVEGETIPARITHDLLVDPDYRGKGLAKALVDYQVRTGEFFTGGMWMNVPCYKIHLACGFDAASELTTHTLVLDPAAFAARKNLSTIKRGLAKVGLGLTRSRVLGKSSVIMDRMSGNGAVKTVDGFDASLDPVWSRMLETYAVAGHRNAALLNWKYSGHPVLDYKILVAERGGEAAGYMVWRLPPASAEEKRANIVDFVVGKGDADTLRFMLAKVILESAENGVEALSILTAQPWAIKLLKSMGFFPRGASHTWAIANWSGRIAREWLTDLEPWHVTMGDSDGDYWTGSQ